MLRALYVLFGLIVIGGYGWSSWRGLELRRTKQTLTAGAAGARAVGGGGAYYRGGYRGGK